MVDFAGWSMPVQYGSIIAEHQATRAAIGLFDVSHMARFHFHGPGAERLLDRLVTRRVAGLPSGRICYALMTNEAGGILDDVLVYRLTDPALGMPYFKLVVNASNRQKIWNWIKVHRAPKDDVDVVDVTEETAMIAVQGPLAGQLLRTFTPDDPTNLKYYGSGTTELLGASCLISRTGYTGEDGWELVLPAASALDVWQVLLHQGRDQGAVAAGLGCRDTLRLEAAMPLYGHELTEDVNPFQAGLRFAVELDDHEFVGRENLRRLKDDASLPQRVGWEVTGHRPAREGCQVLAEGRTIGRVTSGTTAPTLKRPIAMGYVEPAHAAPGAEMTIDIRGSGALARVVKLPFYRRQSH
jgi:aminomethyltransferase